MSRTTYSLLYLVGYVFVQSFAATIPATLLKTCKPEDSECLKSSAQNILEFSATAFKAIGLPGFEPLYLGTVNVGDADLKLILKDVKVHGFSECLFDNVEHDTKKNIVHMDVECPLTGDGEYVIDGYLFSKKIYGSGIYNLGSEKVTFSVNVPVKIEERNGVKYFNAISYDFKYDFVGKVNIDFQNLYDGDEAQAKPMLDDIKKNSKALAEKYAHPILVKFADSVFLILNQILAIIPANKIENI